MVTHSRSGSPSRLSYDDHRDENRAARHYDDRRRPRSPRSRSPQDDRNPRVARSHPSREYRDRKDGFRDDRRLGQGMRNEQRRRLADDDDRGDRSRPRGHYNGESRTRDDEGRDGGDGGWGAREQRQAGGRDERRSELASQAQAVRGAGAGPTEHYKYGKGDDNGLDKNGPPPPPVEPNFAPSGALAAETNTLRGVVLKYNEPPEARKPTKSWRLYCFKGKEQVDLFHVHRQSAYLIGRDRIVADIPVDHPSTSKQHAVLQFRQVVERNEFGDTKSLTKPFIIDLESANGTLVNDETVPPSRFYELKTGDVLKFAFSTREYVLLAEG
ncbi:hypothetical protein OIO90_002612 [Microbotryomycetes sp. JL221]|nr:hypothetical protein OIO90_002612 [Microbotryomycetes sp. JL221]